ncbi:16 kDa beta-galactoside-binding lectin isoform X11 [Opisthocomus hoazin]|uniref:16 kDa beta-galactoside-binding lectin isoform X11 n=1 Tax=Opisthocomus hoazin TaxID=30419 RepID=UPI003F535B22
MQQGLVVTQLDVQPGECIKVKGKILSDAKGFAVNVGKDSSTLMLHFNPRFDCRGDVNTIVCNSKEDGMWGEEDRKADFPFQHGDKIEMCISFNEAEATVKLPEAEFQFPNRLGMEKIEYLAVEGDFKVKAIKIFPQASEVELRPSPCARHRLYPAERARWLSQDPSTVKGLLRRPLWRS